MYKRIYSSHILLVLMCIGMLVSLDYFSASSVRAYGQSIPEGLDENVLIADFDGDGDVDLKDLNYLLLNWLETDCIDPCWCRNTDLDHSGTVDIADFSITAKEWGLIDKIHLDKQTLLPLESLSITVLDANESCTINIHTPAGVVHAFGGSLAENVCTASYIPSYLTGTYQITAFNNGIPTETEEFVVSDPNQGPIHLSSWASDRSHYFPGEKISLQVELNDHFGQPLESFTKKHSDSVLNFQTGALSVLRKVIGIDPCENLIARLYVYFDTTGTPNIFGNNYAHIYAGTRVDISLYAGDGISPLDPAIGIQSGYENNTDNALAATLIDNSWSIEVDKTIFQREKIAYLDFIIPPASSLSDIVFSVDYIQYNHNSGIGDRVYIADTYVSEGQFPVGYEFNTGYLFGQLGRFPIYLPLNPNSSGMLFFYSNYDDFLGHNLHHGTISHNGGGYYTNVFPWTKTFQTTAHLFCYADKWGHERGLTPPLLLTPEPDTRDDYHILEYNLSKRAYTAGETTHFQAVVRDPIGDPVNEFCLKESVVNSDSGKLSIFSQNIRTEQNGDNVVRLLSYFDTTGRWSALYAGTSVDITIFGPDGKSGIDPNIAVLEGSVNAERFSTSLTKQAGVYSWHISLDETLNGIDAQLYLDFILPPGNSSSEVIYRIDRIVYKPDMSWSDSLAIKGTTLSMNQFPLSGSYGKFEFKEGSRFSNLGYFPLYLSLNPRNSSLFIRLIGDKSTPMDGTLLDDNGAYTYSHTWPVEDCNDYRTSMCISMYGYFANKNRCTEEIMLFFTGEPRYLEGLVDEPVLLDTTWQVDLHDYFYVEPDYNNVEYFSSDPCVIVSDNIASFTPRTTEDTAYDVVITARSILDPCRIVSSDPFTLYAANCADSYDCDEVPEGKGACINYQCQYPTMKNSYYMYPQGVDLCVFNKDVSISNPFPVSGEQIEICATVANTGTTNIFDVSIDFYLDDLLGDPIAADTNDVLPTTYMDLPFRAYDACVQWTVPSGLEGKHRIWVKLSGDYPLGMIEDMMSNNYATVDFYVHDPCLSHIDPCLLGPCPTAAMFSEAPLLYTNDLPTCTTMNIIIPIVVHICEDEIVCGPVTGYELSYWSTIYWPSWSGYCQEFGVPQEAITDFIRMYERLVGLGSSGAGSQIPSLLDMPGLLEAPEGWSDGWLPCHPEPTLFPYIFYGGVFDPGCGGLCPVSAWDCGQGVSFSPRFDSPYYNAYAFNVSGGAKKITRCHNEIEYIEIPYQLCYPDSGDPSFNIPFSPFSGGLGGENGGYGGSGFSGPGSGPGGQPPIRFRTGHPVDQNGNSVGFNCIFCSTGTDISNSPTDIIHCEPDGIPASADFTFLKSETGLRSDSEDQMVAFYESPPPIYYPKTPDIPSAIIGQDQIAPIFTLTNVKGKAISLIDYRGRQVVLVFGNLHCPFTVARVPFLNRFSADTDSEDLKIVFVALGETMKSAKEFCINHNVGFEVLVDPYHQVGRLYGISKVPEAFIIDTDGRILAGTPQLGQIVWQMLAED